MRGTAPAMKAVDIWDVLVASIVKVGSIGEVLDDLTAVKIAKIPQFTEYLYDASIGADAYFVPPQGTIICFAWLNVASYLHVCRGITKLWDFDAVNTYSVTGVFYCEGTEIGFKNDYPGSKTLELYGVSMA